MKAAIALLFLFPLSVFGQADVAAQIKDQNRVPFLGLRDLEVGEFGHWPIDPEGKLFFEVKQVLGEKESLIQTIVLIGVPETRQFIEMNKVIRVGTGRLVAPFHREGRLAFVLTDFPTDKLADGSKVRLDGIYKTTGTRKVAATQYFTIRPESAEEKAGREQKEEKLELEARNRQELQTEKQLKALMLKNEKKKQADEKAAEETRKKNAKTALRFAKEMLKAGKLDSGVRRLNDLIKQYPGTDAAKEAERLLGDLNESK